MAVLAAGLQAGAASALSFNFSFSGDGLPINPVTVTGIVSGLADNLPNQTTGLTVTITSATNSPPGGWPIFTISNGGNGFDVAQGQITGVDIRFFDQAQRIFLVLGNRNNYYPQLADTNNNKNNADYNSTPSNSLRFTPADQARVPGPLPLFGAAAAFGWSRRLRRRVQAPL